MAENILHQKKSVTLKRKIQILSGFRLNKLCDKCCLGKDCNKGKWLMMSTGDSYQLSYIQAKVR